MLPTPNSKPIYPIANPIANPCAQLLCGGRGASQEEDGRRGQSTIACNSLHHAHAAQAEDCTVRIGAQDCPDGVCTAENQTPVPLAALTYAVSCHSLQRNHHWGSVSRPCAMSACRTGPQCVCGSMVPVPAEAMHLMALSFHRSRSWWINHAARAVCGSGLHTTELSWGSTCSRSLLIWLRQVRCA